MDSLVTFTDQTIDAKIYDISQHGCFLKMEPVYNIGEEVKITLDIQHALRGTLYGKIVWIARNLKQLPDGIGVKFSKKTSEEKSFIAEINEKLKKLKKESGK
jgi:Tfp pilus assembly protein PilZ